MSHTVLIGLAVSAGLLFAFLGICYRLGERRGLLPCHIAAVLGLFGTVVFGAKALFFPPAEAGPLLPALGPGIVWAFGIAGGAGQAVCVLLFLPALKRGPFSPVWCATNLGFVPTAIYSVGCLHETLGAIQWAGITAAVLCVLAASRTRKDAAAEAASARPVDRFIYMAILFTILVASSIMQIGLKYLETHTVGGSSGPSLNIYSATFLAATYFALGTAMAALAARQPLELALVRRGAVIGTAAACASMAGLYCLSLTAVLAGGVGFAIAAATTILGVAVASSMFFGEPRNRWWYASLALGVASVVLFNIRP